jgi:hypothetical protein
VAANVIEYQSHVTIYRVRYVKLNSLKYDLKVQDQLTPTRSSAMSWLYCEMFGVFFWTKNKLGNGSNLLACAALKLRRVSVQTNL